MQRPYEMGVPVQYEPSPYSERFINESVNRQVPNEFTPGGSLNMDELPNPAFAPENVGDMFSGLSGYEDVQAELEQAYASATPLVQEKVSSEIQRGLNKVLGTDIKPQGNKQSVMPAQTQPWMWIVLGLVVGGSIYLMTSKKGGY